MQRRALLTTLPAACLAGCLDGLPSEPSGSERPTTAVGADRTPNGTDDPRTLTPTTGSGTVRLLNEADVPAEVRVEIHDTDGDAGGFYRWLLADAGEATEAAFSVDAPGEYRVVATLPDLGDRAVSRTATERWAVASVDAPGTVVVTVTEDVLRVTAE